MGLTRGFRVYDEELSVDLRAKRRFEDRANNVTDRALKAVDARDPEKPLFLWVHYWDTHEPNRPKAFARRFRPDDEQRAWLAAKEFDRAALTGRYGDHERTLEMFFPDSERLACP